MLLNLLYACPIRAYYSLGGNYPFLDEYVVIENLAYKSAGIVRKKINSEIARAKDSISLEVSGVWNTHLRLWNTVLRVLF